MIIIVNSILFCHAILMLVYFKQEKLGRLKPGEDLDRAILWKKARFPKDNVIDEELAIITAKIVMLWL